MHNKGKVVASYTYNAWSACKIVSDSTGIIARINPFRYRSYYYQEIGLYYLQSRYYDAGVCRFINADDPIFINVTKSVLQNVFAYCCNYPINQKDYTGFEPITISTSAIVAIVVAVVSVVVLVFVIYAITKILSDPNFQKSVSTALSRVGNRVKLEFQTVVVAIVAAHAIAKTLSSNEKKEVHHIVAQFALRAAPARKILKNKRVNIGINSSTNKAAIKYNLHKRLHTNAYYDAVNAAIKKAYNSGSSGAKQRVTDMLNAIKDMLFKISETTP